VVCSYDPDEPIAEMLAACREFLTRHGGNSLEFRFTGDYRKRSDLCDPYQDVKGLGFTGFLSRAEYDDMLAAAFAVLCLSTDENVQQCGSIEAMAAGVPVIVSNSGTNRRIFPQGALLADNERGSLVSIFEQMVNGRERLRAEIESLRLERMEQLTRNFEVLRSELAIWM
jgi:glycosyltransferase involved in cell wall biosynthesis